MNSPMNSPKTSPTIMACDLFCGSGGTSTGLMQAADSMGLDVNLVAVNHWQTAIETHTANHPGVTHYCEDLETVNYYGRGQATSVDEPLDTITSRDRFALVDPRLVTDGMLDKGQVIGWLDIRFRMLQPHELAAAMSFPKTYQFAGNREAQVKQIGNSVAVQTAKALCMTILGGLK